jgi:nitrate reductase delta subunit
MFQSFKKSSTDRYAIARVGDWTKTRFGLPDHATVMVAEVNCQVPGCPPVETVIAFWTDPDTRYRFKVFKPVAEVVVDDLPVSWLLPSLLDEDDLGCDCC